MALTPNYPTPGQMACDHPHFLKEWGDFGLMARCLICWQTVIIYPDDLKIFMRESMRRAQQEAVEYSANKKAGATNGNEQEQRPSQAADNQEAGPGDEAGV